MKSILGNHPIFSRIMALIFWKDCLQDFQLIAKAEVM